MTATTVKRLTKGYGDLPRTLTIDVYQSTTIVDGTIVCKNSTGYAVAGTENLGLVACGKAKHAVDNSAGSSGDKSIEVETGVHKWANSSGDDEITIADLYEYCYVVDNQTVAKTSNGGARSVCGIIVHVDSDGVRVFMSPALAAVGVGVIEIPIRSFTDPDGDPLVKFADGASAVPGWNLADSECFGLRWNNHATPNKVLTNRGMPNDLDDEQPLVAHVMASKVGATLADAVTFDVEAWFQTVGALHDADADCGGTSSAMTGDAASKTVQEETLTIAAADVPASPSAMTLTLKPTDGTLDTDDVIVQRVWLEYAKKVQIS